MGSLNGSGDIGIPRKELQASFERELTQPGSQGKSSFIPTIHRTWKDAAPLASSIGVVYDVYLFFKAYIHQLSILLLTGVVAVLACALRGKCCNYDIVYIVSSHMRVW